MLPKYARPAALLVVLTLWLVGCTADPALLKQLETVASKAGAINVAPSEVTFYLTIVEPKGATDKIPAPDVDPHSLSAGYGFDAPGEFDANNPNRWQVSAYLFSPASLTVAQGDTVTLRTFVVNGDQHTIWLEAPDGSTAQEVMIMNRGREYTLTFPAEQAGYYLLHCNEHAPTMSAPILVLPTTR